MEFSLKKVDEISRELSEFAELLEEKQKKSESNEIKEDYSNYSLTQKLDKIQAEIEILRMGIMTDETIKKVNALNLEQLKKQYQKLAIYNYKFH